MKIGIGLALLIVSILCFTACSQREALKEQEILPPEDDGVLRVLFIGNSHTAYNGGLDMHFNAFAESYNESSQAEKVAPNGFTLEDHLSTPNTLNTIENTPWDIIVLQENSYRAAYEPDLMQQSMADFLTLLFNHPAQVFLFKTWAYQDAPEMNALLQATYAQASANSGYEIIDIGTAWEQVKAQSIVNTYDPDQVHPNLEGTYLTAALFFKKIHQYQQVEDCTYSANLNEEDKNSILNYVSNQTVID